MQYLLLLRGINVSGKRLIKMESLVNLFNSLGFFNVKTYIQSGNIVFESDIVDKQMVKLKIDTAIEIEFGFKIISFIFDSEEWEKAIRNNPFISNNLIDPDKLHLSFLNNIPLAELQNLIILDKNNEDEFKIINNIVYIYCPNGYGNTKFTNTFFEKKLRINSTTRNLKTVLKLRDLLKLNKSLY